MKSKLIDIFENKEKETEIKGKEELKEKERKEPEESKQENPETVEENVRKFHNHKTHPLFPNLSKKGIEKVVSMRLDLNKNGSHFYESKYYLDLLPSDGSNWAFNPLSLQNATTEQHQQLLDNFYIPDDDHKYSPVVNEGLKLFNKWRKYRNKKEWKFEKQDNKIKIYSHESAANGLTVIKGEAAVSYSTPIILGILVNPKQHKFNKKATEATFEVIERLSLWSIAVHANIKTPMLVSDRELCVVRFSYCFRDGSILIGSRSINDERCPVRSKPVRADIKLSLWHIRPRYGKSLQTSKVTYYVQMDLKGAIPKAVGTKLMKQSPLAIFRLATYITSIADTLSVGGLLHIPPYPVLKNLGIDIGWMDRERDGEEKEKESLVIETKDYVFKSIDDDNGNIVCLDEGFNDVVFELNGLNDELLKKIATVIQEGKDRKKDVIITMVQKKNKNDDGAKVVYDAKIND